VGAHLFPVDIFSLPPIVSSIQSEYVNRIMSKEGTKIINLQSVKRGTLNDSLARDQMTPEWKERPLSLERAIVDLDGLCLPNKLY
jgi:hypothetical protein